MSSIIIAPPEVKVVEVLDEFDDHKGWTVSINGTTGELCTEKHAAEAVASGLRKGYDRANLVAGLRQLADWLEGHPTVPARVLAYHHADGVSNRESAKQQLADVLAAADDLEPDVASYNGDPRLVRRFGPEVEWHMNFKRDAIGTPRIDNSAVVWDLPPELTVPEPATAESGGEA